MQFLFSLVSNISTIISVVKWFCFASKKKNKKTDRRFVANFYPLQCAECPIMLSVRLLQSGSRSSLDGITQYPVTRVNCCRRKVHSCSRREFLGSRAILLEACLLRVRESKYSRAWKEDRGDAAVFYLFFMFDLWFSPS